MLSEKNAKMLTSKKNNLKLGFLPFITIIRPLMGTRIMALIGGSMARESSSYIQYANEQIDSRIATYKASITTTASPASTTPSTDAKPIRKDFTDYLLRARDPITSLGLTTAELHADSALLISAGSDTTSITISACLFYLLHNSSTLATVTREIRATFPSLDTIRSGSALSGCVYLRACIDETLRLAPPVPSHLPREVLPGGIHVDGQFLPAGTVVGTAPWAIHHNATYFPDAFAFRPERWIPTERHGGNDNDDSLSSAHAAFCAFSLGPRGCIGKSVAYLEVALALAHLLWSYDICLGKEGPSGGGVGAGEIMPNGWKGKSKKLGPERRRKDEYQLFDHFTADRDGPMVRFRGRIME
jgi:cytochrome P450